MPISYSFVSLGVSSLEETQELVVGKRALSRPSTWAVSSKAPAHPDPQTTPGPALVRVTMQSVRLMPPGNLLAAAQLEAGRAGRRLKPSGVGCSGCPSLPFHSLGSP